MVSQCAWNRKAAWIRFEAQTHDSLRGDDDGQAEALGLLFDMRESEMDLETTRTAVNRVVANAQAIATVQFNETDIYELEKLFRKVKARDKD